MDNLGVLLFCRCRGASLSWDEECLACAAEGCARASSHTPGGNNSSLGDALFPVFPLKRTDLGK